MKTLSFIAYRQPVTQSYLAKVRGNLTYSHVKQLQEAGLIEEEKLGRTKILRTTPNFADYFNLSQDLQSMKKQLEKLFLTISAHKAPKKSPAAPNQQLPFSIGSKTSPLSHNKP
jgi:segregation and condensation protein B